MMIYLLIHIQSHAHDIHAHLHKKHYIYLHRTTRKETIKKIGKKSNNKLNKFPHLPYYTITFPTQSI